MIRISNSECLNHNRALSVVSLLLIPIPISIPNLIPLSNSQFSSRPRGSVLPSFRAKSLSTVCQSIDIYHTFDRFYLLDYVSSFALRAHSGRPACMHVDVRRPFLLYAVRMNRGALIDVLLAPSKPASTIQSVIANEQFSANLHASLLCCCRRRSRLSRRTDTIMTGTPTILALSRTILQRQTTCHLTLRLLARPTPARPTLCRLTPSAVRRRRVGKQNPNKIAHVGVDNPSPRNLHTGQ
ncbi:hypothetical protein SCHPADRAFT_451927 [Schizopora paradoxa]|uniref:Uncharacterized protein n=1 Tax=Schizopora paradoxa TaxID=27342 RepID=A0A0H2RQS5_9AGAM|nr:hypothetical protein SCHPADRAFT_451927 [Schizopora paradoxa]